MRPYLHRLGAERTPVLQLDGLGPAPGELVAMAARLTPFPPAVNHYPGLRRILGAADGPAFAYVEALLQAAAPYLAGAFDFDIFDLTEASFSMVTTPAAALTPVQRAPHFDTVEADVFAVMHYLSDTPGTGFFRHRETGIEIVTAENVDAYVAAARRTPAPPGYVRGETAGFACLGVVEGLAGRLVAYPGRLLHSGMIPAEFTPSDDPAHGRLTTNIFIKSRQASRR